MEAIEREHTPHGDKIHIRIPGRAVHIIELATAQRLHEQLGHLLAQGTKYDVVIDHYDALTPLLPRQLFQAIVDQCTQRHYIPSWKLAELRPEFNGLRCHVGCAADYALNKLIELGLVQEVPDLGSRYQPTSLAWATIWKLRKEIEPSP